MSSAVAGQVAGPRPGLAFVSFWQGIVDIGLRVIVLVVAFVAFITACVAVGTINNIDEDILDDIDEDKDDRASDTFLGEELPDTPGIVGGSRAACGWVMFLCILAFIYQPLIVLLRFLNIGFINLNILVFLVVDMVVGALWILGYFAAGIAQAAWAAAWGEWRKWANDAEDDSYYGDIAEDFVDREDLNFGTIEGAMGACAFFSFILMVLFIGLVIWVIMFLIFKWNDNVIKETATGAAPGIDPK